jgi:hypothetical protein
MLSDAHNKRKTLQKHFCCLPGAVDLWKVGLKSAQVVVRGAGVPGESASKAANASDSDSDA